MSTIPEADTINSLEELMAVMSRLRELKGPDDRPLKYLPQELAFVEGLKVSPYRNRGKSLNLWFRGERNASYSLAPGAFRTKEIGDEKADTFYEETAATFHFMLRRPEYRTHCASDFEWLSLFQHYGGLTRLLDWSENATVAAFFAVEQHKEDDDKEGSLYVLNASLLNQEASLVAHEIPEASYRDGVVVSAENEVGIFIDTSPDVILRSAQAFCRTDYEWRSRIDSVLHSGLRAELRWLAAALTLLDEYACVTAPIPIAAARRDLAEIFRKKLTYPVAVFPHRSNSRLVAQAGMFTLHGGKGKVQTKRKGQIPRPMPLEELAAQHPNEWLLRYRIPVRAKSVIRAQLQAVGVHRSTLFPEVQSDGEIMRDLWCQ